MLDALRPVAAWDLYSSFPSMVSMPRVCSIGWGRWFLWRNTLTSNERDEALMSPKVQSLGHTTAYVLATNTVYLRGGPLKMDQKAETIAA